MKHLINKLTGGDMWVADNRVNEYLAAGHNPAVSTKKPTEPEKVEAVPITESKTRRNRKAVR